MLKLTQFNKSPIQLYFERFFFVFKTSSKDVVGFNGINPNTYKWMTKVIFNLYLRFFLCNFIVKNLFIYIVNFERILFSQRISRAESWCTLFLEKFNSRIFFSNNLPKQFQPRLDVERLRLDAKRQQKQAQNGYKYNVFHTVNLALLLRKSQAVL